MFNSFKERMKRKTRSTGISNENSKRGGREHDNCTDSGSGRGFKDDGSML